MIVAATYMSVNGEAFGLVLNGKVVYCEILQSLMLKSEAFAAIDFQKSSSTIMPHVQSSSCTVLHPAA